MTENQKTSGKTGMAEEIPIKKITLKIALTAAFTALVTIATTVMAIPYAAGGYFNPGEAIIYVAAMLLGPVAGGIAGGVGAMLGDLVLAPAYAPGTLVIKFIEGLIVGFLFKKLKANMNEESLKSGKTRMRILQSGFLVATAIIIIGVNADPADTIIWVILGSIFICIALLSVSLGKIPLYYMIVSMLAGGIVIIIGYWLYSTFVLGYLLAYTSMPFDTIQVLLGILLAVLIYQPLQKVDILKNLS